MAKTWQELTPEEQAAFAKEYRSTENNSAYGVFGGQRSAAQNQLANKYGVDLGSYRETFTGALDNTPLGGVIEGTSKLVSGDPLGALDATVQGGTFGAVKDGQTTEAVGGVVDFVKDAYGGVDTTQVKGDRDRNLDLYNRALGLEPPKEVAYNLDPNIERVENTQVVAPGDISAPTMGAVERVGTRDVTAPDLGAAREVAQQRLGPTSLATAERVAGANIDLNRADAVRGRELGLATSLEDTISGKTPSAAENQFKGALADVARNVSGKAATARGSDRAYARLTAGRDISDMGRRAASDAAMMRAGESATARGQLSSVLGGLRTSDVGLATEQARLKQAADTTSATLGTDVSKYNAGSLNRSEEVGAELRARGDEFNAAAANKRTELGGQMQLTADTGNADRTLAGDTTNANATNRREEVGAGMTLDASKTNQTKDLTVATKNADLTQRTGEVNAGAQNTRTEKIADGTLGADTTNANLTQRSTEFGQTAAQDASNAASGDTKTSLEIAAGNKAGKRQLIQGVTTGLTSLITGAQTVAPSTTGGTTTTSPGSDGVMTPAFDTGGSAPVSMLYDPGATSTTASALTAAPPPMDAYAAAPPPTTPVAPPITTPTAPAAPTTTPPLAAPAPVSAYGAVAPTTTVDNGTTMQASQLQSFGIAPTGTTAAPAPMTTAPLPTGAYGAAPTPEDAAAEALRQQRQLQAYGTVA